MNENPYQSPQTLPENNPTSKTATLIIRVRSEVAAIGLELSVGLLLLLQIITIVPGTERSSYQMVAFLGCLGLLHPNWPRFVLGVISLLASGSLLL